MAIGTTLDITNFSGVGVIQTSNKEDEVIVTHVGELIVCVNRYNSIIAFKCLVVFFELSSILAFKSPSK